ncbi:MAG TPA: hypothetical protein VF211_13395 [Burkholderiales bacterium]
MKKICTAALLACLCHAAWAAPLDALLAGAGAGGFIKAANGQGNCGCNQYIEPPYNCQAFVSNIRTQCYQIQNARRDASQCWNHLNSEVRRCSSFNQQWINQCNAWLARNCRVGR